MRNTKEQRSVAATPCHRLLTKTVVSRADTMRRTPMVLAWIVLAVIAGVGASSDGYGEIPQGGGGRIDLSTQARFSMNGIEGVIHFYQAADDPNEPVLITVSLDGLDQYREDYGWHVHEYPVNFGLLRDYACSDSEVGGHFDPRGAAVNNPDYDDDCAADIDACEIGDLAGKLGPILWDEQGDQLFEDQRLSLFGPESIVGRSVVLHRTDGTRIACANIELQGRQVITWRYPFQPGPIIMKDGTEIPNSLEGDVVFRRVEGRDEMFIDVDVYRVDGGPSPSSGHEWNLRRGTCTNLGEVYGTMTFEDAKADIESECSETNHRLCYQGDLAAKCGTLEVTDANRIKDFCADDQLGVTRQTDLMSLALVIQDANNSESILACSERVPVNPQSGFAYFREGSIFTYLAFYQADPHDRTFVRAYVLGLNGEAGYFEIHEDPVPADGNCSNVGDIFDKPDTPFYSDAIFSGAGVDTDNLGPIGRLENKFSDFEGRRSFIATESTSFLPLFPPFSIFGHSLVLYDINGEVWGCTTIMRFDPVPEGMASITGYV